MRSEAYMSFKRTRDRRTLHFTRLFRNTIKATCDVVARAGSGEGAFLVVLPVAVEPERRTDFIDWCNSVLLPEALETSNVVAAAYAEHNPETRQAAAAHDVRTGDRHLESVLLLEAASERGVSNAVRCLRPNRLEAHGARPQIVEQPCVFRVIYTLHA
jgi:hypothetical protein